jgi:hypothetical protein
MKEKFDVIINQYLLLYEYQFIFFSLFFFYLDLPNKEKMIVEI